MEKPTKAYRAAIKAPISELVRQVKNNPVKSMLALMAGGILLHARISNDPGRPDVLFQNSLSSSPIGLAAFTDNMIRNGMSGEEIVRQFWQLPTDNLTQTYYLFSPGPQSIGVGIIDENARNTPEHVIGHMAEFRKPIDANLGRDLFALPEDVQVNNCHLQTILSHDGVGGEYVKVLAIATCETESREGLSTYNAWVSRATHAGQETTSNAYRSDPRDPENTLNIDLPPAVQFLEQYLGGDNLNLTPLVDNSQLALIITELDSDR